MFVLVIITKNKKTDGVLIKKINVQRTPTHCYETNSYKMEPILSVRKNHNRFTPYTIQTSYSVEHLNKPITAHIIRYFKRHVHTDFFWYQFTKGCEYSKNE